ncbi:phytanoyl-CoA dioxygenase family protein [Paenibacillus cisolokensis]|uniref:phytanoyl-CoA dioxygenase family protein n=1 Tax=Paenibacillus cisolokensis TaxID=1658519 RepID=UPI003D2BDB53
MKLTVDQIIRYQTEGYLIVEDAIPHDELKPVMNELAQEIDRRSRMLHAEGKLANLYEDEPFERRYALLYEQCAEIGRGFDISDYLGEQIFRFMSSDSLLDLAECLLGSELSCNPIQHVRAKLPWKPSANAFENVPWHQDCAVTSEDSEASDIITFWVPLVDATADTGCMELMPGVFKQGYLRHQASGGTTIVPELLPDVEPVLAECRKGGVVIMNKYTPHRGIPNRSGIVRWSIDLRYHKTGARSGRDGHPSFVARSRVRPDTVLTDVGTWRTMWRDAKQQSSEAKLHRV